MLLGALPPEFDEVSGLAVSPDGKFFLHGDEVGVVGAFDPESGKVSAVCQLGPSSMEVGPQTGDYVRIASADYGFLVLDPSGRGPGTVTAYACPA